MKTLILIGLGGGLGSIFRYLISVFFLEKSTGLFPTGTFVANLLGCFLIGLFMGLLAKGNMLSEEAKFFLTTGFCGGFTTFSTFSLESFELLKTGEYGILALYIGASIVLGMLLAFAGFMLGK